MKKFVQINDIKSTKTGIPYAEAIKRNGIYRKADGFSHVRFLVVDGIMFIVGDGDPFYRTMVDRSGDRFELISGESINLTFKND